MTTEDTTENTTLVAIEEPTEKSTNDTVIDIVAKTMQIIFADRQRKVRGKQISKSS